MPKKGVNAAKAFGGLGLFLALTLVSFRGGTSLLGAGMLLSFQYLLSLYLALALFIFAFGFYKKHRHMQIKFWKTAVMAASALAIAAPYLWNLYWLKSPIWVVAYFALTVLLGNMAIKALREAKK